MTGAASPDTFKTWPKSMVESHGDYREEAYLEDFIGGPLYSKQKSLPRLPIPNIQDTMDRFLPTALPLAENEEEKNSLLEACASFPHQAEELQRRLQKRRDEEMKDSSWLQLWWNTAGYLQVRDPVVVNVSYFFQLSDDGTLPFNSKKSLGVMRGAAVLVAAAEYRKLVCSGSLPYEAIGRKEPKTPLCSVAFKYMFNSCRVPHRGQDSYRMYDPSLHSHCVVARKGQFFAVDFIDEVTGDPLPLEIIEDRLQQCVELADKGGESLPKLGWLTSSDRDSWADARDELLRVGGEKMESALEKLESGALLLCLDDEEPVSKSQTGALYWHGGVSSGHNRWFDKSMQIICTENGKVGFLGEHSMMDGMPAVAFCGHIIKSKYEILKEESKNTGYLQKSSIEVTNIFNDCLPLLHSSKPNEMINTCISNAEKNFKKVIADNQLDVQSFQAYGAVFMKKAGFSPDAYVQMAIQLATFRLFGKQVGTYESTQVRPFLHGRTETTRSVSMPSAAFVKRMGLRPMHEDAEEAGHEKLSLLREAATQHSEFTRQAAKGMGVDRHLMGLSMLVNEGEEIPALFSHPVYARSKYWRVSTSTLPNIPGFGPVVADGVGVAYDIRDDCCFFTITGRREHDLTDRLSHLLEEALLEMSLLPMMSKL